MRLRSDQFVSTALQISLWHIDSTVQVAIIYLLLLGPLVVAVEALFTDRERRDGLVLGHKVRSEAHLVMKGYRRRNASRYVIGQESQPVASQSVSSIS